MRYEVMDSPIGPLTLVSAEGGLRSIEFGRSIPDGAVPDFALAVRLFANMTAGHFVILALLGLILTFGSFTSVTGWTAILGPIALGLFVMFLEIFVALLQAYIFTVLTAVFIGLIRAH